MAVNGKYIDSIETKFCRSKVSYFSVFVAYVSMEILDLLSFALSLYEHIQWYYNSCTANNIFFQRKKNLSPDLF